MTFSTKEIMREAAKPTWNSMAKLKRLIRYIRGRPRCELAFPWSDAKAATELDIVVDSDWGGCAKTRCSTSGGVLLLGDHLLRHWSGTQATVSLSSAEAETKAITKGCVEGLYMKHLLQGQNFGEVKITI